MNTVESDSNPFLPVIDSELIRFLTVIKCTGKRCVLVHYWASFPRIAVELSFIQILITLSRKSGSFKSKRCCFTCRIHFWLRVSSTVRRRRWFRFKSLSTCNSCRVESLQIQNRATFSLQLSSLESQLCWFRFESLSYCNHLKVKCCWFRVKPTFLTVTDSDSNYFPTTI